MSLTGKLQGRSDVGGKIRICIVDDHPIVREGLRKLLDLEPDMVVCAEAENYHQAVEKVAAQLPDLIVVDISLQDRSGIDLIKELRAQDRKMPILVLSVHAEPTYAERALRAGAQGYVMKDNAPELITRAVRRLMAGEVFVCEQMSARLLSRLVGREDLADEGGSVARLTDRELEVLELIARGEKTGQIARRLSLSVSTVETHQAKIKRKLGLAAAPDLIRFAAEWQKSELGPKSSSRKN